MHRYGFSLVEIIVVILLIAIISAIATPIFMDRYRDTQQTAFAEQLRIFVDIGFLVMADSSHGRAAPTGGYFLSSESLSTTPIGGKWDVKFNSYGIKFGIGVYFSDAATRKSDAYMTEIDEIMDDGDLAKGSFRKLDTGRFYHVLAE